MEPSGITVLTTADIVVPTILILSPAVRASCFPFNALPSRRLSGILPVDIFTPLIESSANELPLIAPD